MIIMEIILSLAVGMWMISLIILPTNKLREIDNEVEIDMKKNINIMSAQQSLYESTNNILDEDIDINNINSQLYDTSLKKYNNISDNKTYTKIIDQKVYYLKSEDQEDEKIFKSNKWTSGERTLEGVTFSENKLGIELRRYLENIKLRTGTLDIDDIHHTLKQNDINEDEVEMLYSFDNPISKIEIDKDNKSKADVEFVTVLDITKEIDKWKIQYVISKGEVSIDYIDQYIDLDKDYKVEGNVRKFILEIPRDKTGEVVEE